MTMMLTCDAEQLLSRLNLLGSVHSDVLISVDANAVLKASGDFMEVHAKLDARITAPGSAFVSRADFQRIIAGCRGDVTLALTGDTLEVQGTRLAATLATKPTNLFHSYGMARPRMDTGLTVRDVVNLRSVPDTNIEGWDNISLHDGYATGRFNGGLCVQKGGDFEGGGCLPLSALSRLSKFDPNARVEISDGSWGFIGKNCAASGVTALGKIDDWQRLVVTDPWAI